MRKFSRFVKFARFAKVSKVLDIGYFERPFSFCLGCTFPSVECKMASTFCSEAACTHQRIYQSNRKFSSLLKKVGFQHHHKTQLHP
jgi:hypothetical protein